MENALLNAIKEFSDARWVRKDLVQSDQMVVKMMCYEPGQQTPLHAHKRQDEVFLFIEGHGTMVVGEETIRVEPTSMVFVPATVPHSVKPDDDSRLVMFYVKAPGSDRPPKA